MAEYLEALEAHSEASADPKTKAPNEITGEKRNRLLRLLKANANA
jgi:hypothetical protein